MTPPMMPVILIADGELQEKSHLRRCETEHPEPRTGDASARRLRCRRPKPRVCWVAAEKSRINCRPGGTHRSRPAPCSSNLPKHCKLRFVDMGGRMNFPTRHPLNQTWRGRAMKSPTPM